MIKCRIVHILLLAAGLSAALFSKAQELPVLPADPAIMSGMTPNGMSYYVVSDKTSKGFADFTLVQRTGRITAAGADTSAINASRSALSSLPRLASSTAQQFVSSHGAAPGAKGYVHVTDDATIFRFNDMEITDASVVDSTLLVLMDIADRSTSSRDPFVKQWYAPSDQAVIVAGDVNASDVVHKIRTLSLMTPFRQSCPRPEYMWTDIEEPEFVSRPLPEGEAAVLSVKWRAPRARKEYMNTVQPVIYEMLVAQVGIIASERIGNRLEELGIPALDVSHRHLTSVETPGDESLTISLVTDSRYVSQALEVMASSLASMDRSGVRWHECVKAKHRWEALSEERLRRMQSNDAFVDRCKAAFLYNASLAAPETVYRFCSSRDISPGTELKLLADISSSLLDGSRNLKVECASAGDIPADSLRTVFEKAWTAAYNAPESVAYGTDSLPEWGPGPKVKVKSGRKEAVSGGTIWKFSNGMTVIYKKMDTDRLHYCLALSEGYSSIADLSEGEGAFMSDYIDLCSIGGLSPKEFSDALMLRDISLETEVSLSDMKVSGSAPAHELSAVMDALISVMNHRRPDAGAADYYRKVQRLRGKAVSGSFESRLAAIDSIMCPGNAYTSFKLPHRLGGDFIVKAEAFFERASSKMNDGVLVIIGNRPEYDVKKQLLGHIGHFRTEEKAFRRPIVRYQPVSGCSTYMVQGEKSAIDLVMSVPLAMTSDNNMAAVMSVLAMKHHFEKALEGTGTHMRISYDFDIYPQERLNVLLSVEPADVHGFAEGNKVMDVMKTLAVVRSAVKSLPEIRIDASRLKLYQTFVKNRVAMMEKVPEHWLQVISRRYVDGKDLFNGYGTRVDAVGLQQVRDITGALSRGSMVEYVTYSE